jgi:hypothetical protein
LAVDFEFCAFFDEGASFVAELVFADGEGIFALGEQGAGRQAESADVFGGDGGGLDVGIGALVDGESGFGSRRWGGGPCYWFRARARSGSFGAVGGRLGGVGWS